MSPEQIRARIAEMAPLAQADPERYHGELDDLRLDVLRTIASYDTQRPWELAAAALETDHITPPWTACA